MRTKRTLPAAQLLLMSPALLFMGALAVRRFSAPQLDPAFTAQRIVMWYAHRLWTLYALLITLPIAALMVGCITLRERWTDVRRAQSRGRQCLAVVHADRATLFVTLMTLAAGVVLAIVATHMAAN